MRLSNFIGGIGIAILISFAFFLRETQLFELRKSFFNPFVSQKILNSTDTISQEKADFFLDSGGFAQLSRGTKVDFSEDKKQLIDGDLFIAGGFGDRLTVRNIEFDIAERIVFVSLDSASRTIEVFSLRGDVPVFIEGEKQFFLPHRNYFKTNLIGQNVQIPEIDDGVWYQHRKAWGIKPWPEEEYLDQFTQLLKEYQQWAQPFSVFADKFLKNWSNGSPRNIAQILQQNYYFFQAHYSFWFPVRKKTRYIFGEKLNTLRDAQILSQNGLYAQASEQVSAFKTVLGSSLWKIFLANNPSFSQQWQYFEWAHKNWLISSPPEAFRSTFSQLWKDSEIEAVSNTDKISRKLVQVTYYEGVQIAKAYEKFLEIGDFFPKEDEEEAPAFDISFYREAGLTDREIADLFLQQQQGGQTTQTGVALEDNVAVTNIRRTITNLLLINRVFQRKAAYEIYQSLVLKELELTPTEDIIEKRKELSFDIFALIEHFINSTSENGIDDVLLSLWRTLEIEAIEQQENIKLFGESQKKLVSFVNISANTALTKEEIERIQQAEELEREFEERIEELRVDNEKITTVNEEKVGIQNPKALIGFLAKSEITIDLLNFKTDRERNVSLFSNAKFFDERIAGEFDYGSQRFLTLVINKTDQYEKIHTSFLNRILDKVKNVNNQERLAAVEQERIDQEKALNQAEEQAFQFVDTDILQNTEKAILARRLVDNILKNHGFTVRRDNIFVLDDELANFGIILSGIFDIYWLRFEYNKTDETFTSLKGKYKLLDRDGNEELGVTEREEREEILTFSGTYTWDQLSKLLTQTIDELEAE